MLEAQGRGVQQESRGFDQRLRVVADIDLFADEWMPRFGEVDPDLMRAAGLEPNAAQRRVAQRALDLDVRHRALATIDQGRRTAQSIAAIRDQLRFDPL